MATKVLVFESDAAFAGELEREFLRRGCVADIVDDGNVGLQKATENAPDLILLSIELPRMNGYSVCNKLKKDPKLKGVPLIIMSSDSSDETFEQHRKLRTHAEDYVKKPIAFRELLEHIRPLLELPEPTLDVDFEDSPIALDDLVEDALVVLEPSLPPNATSSDYAGSTASMGTLADQRIPDNVEQTVSMGAELNLTGSWNESFDEVLSGLEKETGEGLEVAAFGDSQVPPSSTGVHPLSMQPPPSSKSQTASLTARISELENELDMFRSSASRLQDENERLRKELEDVGPKTIAVQSKTAASPSREALELKEAIHRKEREILSLKENLTRRDREAIDNQTRMLELERTIADAEDRALTLERELADARDALESAQQQVAKGREAGLAVEEKLSSFHSELALRQSELEGLRVSHDEALVLRDSREKEQREAHQRELDALRGEFQEARALVQSLQDEVRALDARRQNEVDASEALRMSQLDSLKREMEEAVEAARLARDQAKEFEVALDNERGQLAAALKALADGESLRQGLESELQKKLEDSSVQHESLQEAARQAQSRVDGLEADLSAVRQELESARQKLSEDAQKVAKVQAKWDMDRNSLERAKDALALALAHIEDTEMRVGAR